MYCRNKRFRIKIYKLSDPLRSVCTVYVGRGGWCASPSITATPATVTGLNHKVWKWGTQIISEHNSFIIPALFGSKLSHQQFRLTLVRSLILEVGSIPQPQTTRQGRHAPSARQLDTSTTHTGLCSVKMFSAVCFLLKTKKQNFVVENTMLGRVLAHVLGCITPYCKSGAHRQKWTFSDNWYFSVAFSWWSNGGEGVVDFQRALWRNRFLRRTFMCEFA